MEKIIIFDTTLRDGEQCPGASLNIKEKLEIAKQLAVLGVDIIEAGFPVSSPGDFEAVKTVAKNVKGPVICGLARSVEKDIDAAYDAVRFSNRPRIHVFLATSKIHMKYKLKKAEDEILKLAVAAVKYARAKCPDIEFSPEDASRTELSFLQRVVEAVIDAGAATVNIPDTVGYSTPFEFADIIGSLKYNVPNIQKCVISVHCHNDLGLGVANSLAAVLSGARQVECTINGLGERAGNASLEEIVMAIRTRNDIFKGLYTDINTKELYKTSRLVSKLTGMPVQPNKAIIGANAFAHESGIHQDGVLKERITYEIMRPEDVGFEESKIVLGKHSGRHAFDARLKSMGLDLNKADLDRAFERFKELADKKKEIFDEDLETIVDEEISKMPEKICLVHFHIASGDQVKPTATVTLKYNGKISEASSTGDGPVDACYKAIDKITALTGKLLDYKIRSVTGGKDALGEVTVKVESKGKIFSGRGASTDIIEASIKAYVNAMNKRALAEK
ncbi:MAG: 2-isopropylmalate synthase [Candidatus Omnitrophica bacterium]|nr:2-isopropylmalate synthase [Candidatus Omnitrophota bacterium]MCM8790951.1 2-isopropylmalate synthase [Candidatus Omnitrophota bacterium]